MGAQQTIPIVSTGARRRGTPPDYLERVYAGALGKVLGVYLGRPVESWLPERIARELGEVGYYVHDRLGVPLVVVDDDITGTFTFVRALEDAGFDPAITSAQIGRAWLNYVVPERTIFWWGGLGNSTEHTAYLRLQQGIEAPRSGSMELNGQVVAEQIGGQIFVDGWAMVAPGDPLLAADLAERAARVSHDGEAVHAARALAAMEAAAFVEQDVDALLDTALAAVPPHSVIATMTRDLRAWHRTDPDWRATRDRLDERYGYGRFGGNVHVVPNHGLIVLALLHGGGDWTTSMRIVTTCGWDTDCNAGNLGALLGIRGGLAAFDGGPDWRGPVGDRMYLPTADGGRAVTDVATEAVHLANIGRRLAGEPPYAPKDGARYHFELPGSTHGFRARPDFVRLANVAGPGPSGEGRRLRVDLPPLVDAVAVTTATFPPPEVFAAGGYTLMASPSLHPGQRLRAVVGVDAEAPGPVRARLVVRHYRADDELVAVGGPAAQIGPGDAAELTWEVPPTGGQPIAEAGVEFAAGGRRAVVHLDRLTWGGEPRVVLDRPSPALTRWRSAWVDAMDDFSEGWGPGWPEPHRLIQNRGRGLVAQGTRDWRDVEVSTALTPHLATAAGVAVRLQGLRRYTALLLCADGAARLVRRLDDAEVVLASAPLPWVLGRRYAVALAARGTALRATVHTDAGGPGPGLVLEADDAASPLDGGAVALICEEGRIGAEAVTVKPAP